MAKIPISELVETIELVRSLRDTVDKLVGIVEKLGERVLHLEQKAGDDGANGQ